MNIDKDFELIHGSGNVFADLRLPNPEIEQFRAVLARKSSGFLMTGNLVCAKQKA